MSAPGAGGHAAPTSLTMKGRTISVVTRAVRGASPRRKGVRFMDNGLRTVRKGTGRETSRARRGRRRPASVAVAGSGGAHARRAARPVLVAGRPVRVVGRAVVVRL